MTQPLNKISLPNKATVLRYIATLQQPTQTGNLNAWVYKNSLLASNWIRETQGIYKNQTQTKYEPEKVHIAGLSDWQDLGTTGLPLLNDFSVVEGYLAIFPMNVGGLLELRIQVIGTSADIFDIIGTSKIYLPEITVYRTYPKDVY